MLLLLFRFFMVDCKGDWLAHAISNNNDFTLFIKGVPPTIPWYRFSIAVMRWNVSWSLASVIVGLARFGIAGYQKRKKSH